MTSGIASAASSVPVSEPDAAGIAGASGSRSAASGTGQGAGAATGAPPGRPTVTIVVPAKDEVESLPALVDRVLATAEEHAIAIEGIVLVDDGSTDGSWACMERLAREHDPVRAVRLRRNFGKATALMAGVAEARGDILVTMDADLQDDPKELPRFLDRMAEGYDLVSGWKQKRHDPIGKTLPSKLFNWTTRTLTGVRLHDFNCGYKAYRREIFDTVHIYGELHRYVPVLAHALGFRVGELVVEHHPRRFGRSKYGVGRLLRGYLDLLTVLMITRYQHRPGHLFGGLGTGMSALGVAILLYLTGLKLFTGADIGTRPLLLLGVMLMIIGVQLLLFGLLAELFNSRTQIVAVADLVRDRTTGKAADAPAAERPPG